MASFAARGGTLAAPAVRVASCARARNVSGGSRVPAALARVGNGWVGRQPRGGRAAATAMGQSRAGSHPGVASPSVSLMTRGGGSRRRCRGGVAVAAGAEDDEQFAAGASDFDPMAGITCLHTLSQVSTFPHEGLRSWRLGGTPCVRSGIEGNNAYTNMLKCQL